MRLQQRLFHHAYLLAFALLLFSMPVIQGSCKKDKPKPQEEALVVTMTPDPGTTIARAMGAVYDFQVGITSALPLQGVSITVAYKKDSDQSSMFNQSYTVTNSSQNIVITGIPFNEVGTVTVIVTSRTKPSNTVTKTFKLVRK